MAFRRPAEQAHRVTLGISGGHMLKVFERARAVLLLAIMLAVAGAEARAQVAIDALGADLIHAGEFIVPINKSQVLKVDQPFTELLIGTPEIADVVALTNQSVYVLGKQLGTTNLTIYGPRRQLQAVLDLAVTGDLAFNLITSSGLPISPFPFGIGTLDTGGNPDLSTTFQTLEQNGLVRTLAEPNLIALSGDTANFLAGGEFPIPVESEDDTVTVEFKEFGVALAFTPTVIGKD